jgi:hypothetical protein
MLLSPFSPPLLLRSNRGVDNLLRKDKWGDNRDVGREGNGKTMKGQKRPTTKPLPLKKYQHAGIKKSKLFYLPLPLPCGGYPT